MSLPQIVRRYALALFEVAKERSAVAEVETDMEALNKIFREMPQVRDWCREGRLHFASAETFVSTAFLPFVGPLTATTLELAARHDRLAVIPLLPEALRILADRASSKVRVVLETVQKPERELVDRIAVAMTQRTGKFAVVTNRVRPELIGGFRILWNDSVIDLTAKEKLRRLRTLLTSP